MLIDTMEKQTAQEIIDSMGVKLIKDPMFMYLCPNLNDREKFINAFFNYYLFEWAEYDTLVSADNKMALATLINPRSFEYKFKGKGAFNLKRQKTSSLILEHRKDLRSIVHILAPGTMSPRVLTIYGNTDKDMDAIESVIDQSIEIANENGYTLVYETFSQRLISLMESKGFIVGYQRNYSDTRFIQTLMTYSALGKSPQQDEESE